MKLVLAIGTVLCISVAAFAEKRVALVVGNAAYTRMPVLANPIHDAEDVGTRLSTLGFQVIKCTDAGFEAFERCVRDFVAKLDPNDVALFFYAGHGVQVEGINYLIPVDLPDTDEITIRTRSVAANAVHQRMEKSQAAFNILILDACRDFPSGSRSVKGGLGAMSSGTTGTYIAFATADGKTAADNPSGRNGLFTSHILKTFDMPGLGLSDFFREVRKGVVQASNKKQVPYGYENLVNEFYFNPGNRIPTPNGGDPPPPPVPSPRPAAPTNPPPSTSLAARLLSTDPREVMVVVQGKSGMGSTVMGTIVVQIDFTDSVPQVGLLSGDLPGTPISLALASTENVKAHSIQEGPSPLNNWTRFRLRVEPEDVQQSVKLVFKYQGITLGKQKGRR